MPGVVGVYSSADLELPDHVGMVQLNPHAIRPPLARDRVRYVGDAVVVVAAETKAQAVDAAEAVIVDYEPLDVVADAEAALAPDAPLQFEAMGTNLVMGMREPDGFDPLEGADVIVRCRIENQRLAVVPMEGAAVAVDSRRRRRRPRPHALPRLPDAARQPRRRSRRSIGIDPATVRVIAPNVGGSFGAKHWAPEHSRRDRGGACARSTGEVGGDPLGEHDGDASRPGSGPVRRARPPS